MNELWHQTFGVNTKLLDSLPERSFLHEPTLGKYQYLYQKGEDLVSLVEFPTAYEWLFHGPMWEAMCIKGQLFEGEERFPTKEQAEEKLKEYFKDDVIVDEDFRLPDHFYQPYGGVPPSTSSSQKKPLRPDRSADKL